jgi:hypothetical protein
MAEPGTPDWWLDRLYRKLHARAPIIRDYDLWYTGEHPAPAGHEKAGPLLVRLLDTIGLNMLSVVAQAPQDRMEIAGFTVDGKASDDAWELWEANKFGIHSEQVREERMGLSAAYVMVDPNDGEPIYTPEHPEQCITENTPGRTTTAAGLKVWFDDTSSTPMVKAFLDLGGQVYTYAAPTRIFANVRTQLAMKPAWELQEEGTGPNSLGEVSIVPFLNRERMLKAPLPEWWPALKPQKRINKTLMDRMANQDQGAFKAMWATGLDIPVDPETQQPVEPFQKAIDRMFVNENPEGKFGQLEADEIKQLLDAVRDDIVDCAIVVPTSPDAIMGKLVNVSGDGLKLAQVSELKRTKRHIRIEGEGYETVTRLGLKAAGKSVANPNRMSTIWTNPEFRTEGELSDAATKALANGVPHEVVWEKYYGATPDQQRDWRERLDQDGFQPIVDRLTRPPAPQQEPTGGDPGQPVVGG